MLPGVSRPCVARVYPGGTRLVARPSLEKAYRRGPWTAYVQGQKRPHDRTRMPRAEPAVLELLADGVPRSKAAIVAALADRHAKGDVVRTLMRLAVTGRVDETGGRYTLATESGPDPE